MSFADGETVMKTVESLIRDIRRPHSPQPYFLDAGESFPRMTYQQAMDKYGSDKPDTRNNNLVGINSKRLIDVPNFPRSIALNP